MKTRRNAWLSLFSLLVFAASATGQPGQDFRILDLERELTLFSASIGSGARSLAMGGAFIAIADDGTAASWNPAGLGVLEESEFAFNWQPVFSETLTKPATRVVATAPVSTDAEILFADTGETRLSRTSQTVDFLSLAAPFRIGGRKLVPQFSFHRVVPSLDAEFQGSPSEAIVACGIDCRERQVIEGSAVVESNGGIDLYAASLGVQLRENLFLGASLNWWRGDTRSRIDGISTQLSSGEDTPELDAVETELRTLGSFEQNDRLSGFNVNLGTILALSPRVHVGAVFKTPFQMHRRGVAENRTSFLIRSTRDPSALAYRALSLEVTATSEGDIDWPATVGVGLAWFPSNVATISTDFTWSNWSAARYDETLTLTNSLEPEPAVTRREDLYPSDRQVDAWQYRLGGELVMVGPSVAKLLAIPLRGGLVLDRQYFLDFKGDTVLGRGVSGGFGLVWSQLTIDFAYSYAFAPREPAARVEEIVLGSNEIAVPFEGFRQEPGEGRFSRHKVLLTAILRF